MREFRDEDIQIEVRQLNGHQWGDLWDPMRPHAYVVHLAANAPYSIVSEVAPPVSERIVKVEFQVEPL